MLDIIEQKDRFEAYHQGASGHAVILLPGLCGSELEMGALPRLLKQSGHTYVVPRILGYSAHSGFARHSEWTDAVEQLVHDLEKSHHSVSIVGLSMGATLAMSVAARHHSIVSLCLLSPVLFFDGWAIPWYHPLLSLVCRLGIRNWYHKETEPFGVKNIELRKHILKAVLANSVSELGAAHLPARHIYESMSLIDSTIKNMKDVVSDTLIIHAIDDETASPRNVEAITKSISSQTKRVIWLGNSYHMITVDNEREIVTNEVNNFIALNLQKLIINERLNIETPMLLIKNRSNSN
jgi:carboxylesterase